MLYFWWGCRGNLKMVTLGSERVSLSKPRRSWYYVVCVAKRLKTDSGSACPELIRLNWISRDKKLTHTRRRSLSEFAKKKKKTTQERSYSESPQKSRLLYSPIRHLWYYKHRSGFNFRCGVDPLMVFSRKADSRFTALRIRLKTSDTSQARESTMNIPDWKRTDKTVRWHELRLQKIRWSISSSVFCQQEGAYQPFKDQGKKQGGLTWNKTTKELSSDGSVLQKPVRDGKTSKHASTFYLLNFPPLPPPLLRRFPRPFAASAPRPAFPLDGPVPALRGTGPAPRGPERAPAPLPALPAPSRREPPPPRPTVPLGFFSSMLISWPEILIGWRRSEWK